MAGNSLKELNELGQSVWLDYLSRNLITSGKLKHLIDEDGLSGVTSNPTIFQKAITGSSDYDESLRKIIQHGVHDDKELFLGLAMEDISQAADILLPVYESTRGRDGYISLEVSPDLAFDTQRTIDEAKYLFETLGKKNIMIKVPATGEGLPAVEQLTAEGVNVNITLLFSVRRYREVAEAFIAGLEKRISQGLTVDGISSVASFFVSRVDTLVDKILQEKIETPVSEDEKEQIRTLMGKAAVANAKLAYIYYERIFLGERFKTAEENGARPQRLLWGSTSTKNSEYSDIKYVEELIAPDTVNTLPEDTMMAFKDHGIAKVTIRDAAGGAEAFFAELGSLGIDIEQVADQLEKEGVKSFSDSYFSVLKETAQKRDAILTGKSA